MYSKYTYGQFSWIGPQIDLYHEVNLFGLNEPHIISEPIDHNVETCDLKFIPSSDGLFVVSSSFMTLDDDVIVSQPLSYKECFGQIMNYVNDEIKANNLYGRPGDHMTVEACLKCHQIISL